MSNKSKLTKRGVGRRRFVQGAALAGGAAMLGSLSKLAYAAPSKQSSALFTLGVASGDPDASSVMLWTRLAPDPLNGGGMPDVPVRVEWELATDEGMRHVIRRGAHLATSRFGHTVNVIAGGLDENTTYWYRFEALGETSPVGRTKTFPAAFSMVERMRFALGSCQNYESGYYNAYRDMNGLAGTDDDLDFIVHVGDYMYEGATNPNAVRPHEGPEPRTIEGYRNRYAQYRLDEDLREAHRLFPFVVTWDDHEVDNNYAGIVPEDNPNDPQTIQEFLERRAQAYQVYAETMPIRPRRNVRPDDTTLYRRLRFGQLAELNVMDTRQYRTNQPCGDGLAPRCPEAFAPGATMAGNEQEQWLFDGLRSSNATWNVMAQGIMMMQWDLRPLSPGGSFSLFNLDAWDGYPEQRQRFMNFFAEYKDKNPVVLTGDIHSSWAADLKANFDDPSSEIVGAEFVCPGISSLFGDDNDPLVRATLPANPHIKFFDGLHRGYDLHEVTPDLWRCDFRAVRDNTQPDSEVFTQGSFGTRAGDLGVFAL